MKDGHLVGRETSIAKREREGERKRKKEARRAKMT